MPDATPSKQTVTLGKMSWAGRGGGEYYGKSALAERIPTNKADLKYITSEGKAIETITAEQPFLYTPGEPPKKTIEYGLVTRYDLSGNRIPDPVPSVAELQESIAGRTTEANKILYAAGKLQNEQARLELLRKNIESRDTSAMKFREAKSQMGGVSTEQYNAYTTPDVVFNTNVENFNREVGAYSKKASKLNERIKKLEKETGAGSPLEVSLAYSRREQAFQNAGLPSFYSPSIMPRDSLTEYIQREGVAGAYGARITELGKGADKPWFTFDVIYTVPKAKASPGMEMPGVPYVGGHIHTIVVPSPGERANVYIKELGWNLPLNPIGGLTWAGGEVGKSAVAGGRQMLEDWGVLSIDPNFYLTEDLGKAGWQGMTVTPLVTRKEKSVPLKITQENRTDFFLEWNPKTKTYGTEPEAPYTLWQPGASDRKGIEQILSIYETPEPSTESTAYIWRTGGATKHLIETIEESKNKGKVTFEPNFPKSWQESQQTRWTISTPRIREESFITTGGYVGAAVGTILQPYLAKGVAKGISKLSAVSTDKLQDVHIIIQQQAKAHQGTDFESAIYSRLAVSETKIYKLVQMRPSLIKQAGGNILGRWNLSIKAKPIVAYEYTADVGGLGSISEDVLLRARFKTGTLTKEATQAEIESLKIAGLTEKEAKYFASTLKAPAYETRGIPGQFSISQMNSPTERIYAWTETLGKKPQTLFEVSRTRYLIEPHPYEYVAYKYPGFDRELFDRMVKSKEEMFAIGGKPIEYSGEFTPKGIRTQFSGTENWAPAPYGKYSWHSHALEPFGISGDASPSGWVENYGGKVVIDEKLGDIAVWKQLHAEGQIGPLNTIITRDKIYVGDITQPMPGTGLPKSWLLGPADFEGKLKYIPKQGSLEVGDMDTIVLSRTFLPKEQVTQATLFSSSGKNFRQNMDYILGRKFTTHGQYAIYSAAENAGGMASAASGTEFMSQHMKVLFSKELYVTLQVSTTAQAAEMQLQKIAAGLGSKTATTTNTFGVFSKISPPERKAFKPTRAEAIATQTATEYQSLRINRTAQIPTMQPLTAQATITQTTNVPATMQIPQTLIAHIPKSGTGNALQPFEITNIAETEAEEIAQTPITEVAQIPQLVQIPQIQTTPNTPNITTPPPPPPPPVRQNMNWKFNMFKIPKKPQLKHKHRKGRSNVNAITLIPYSALTGLEIGGQKAYHPYSEKLSRRTAFELNTFGMGGITVPIKALRQKRQKKRRSKKWTRKVKWI